VTRLRAAAAIVFVVAAAAAALGIGVRATFGAHAAVDEPQYLLTAISLAEDRDLDITDEIAQERWRDFADLRPPVQTQPRPDGSQLSPHDPLLPILLAVPVGVAGWIAGKVALALLAGAVAVLTLWLAVRRFDVDLRLAAVGVGLAAASAPLAVYGQQVYPELPAAAVTLVGVAAATAGHRLGGPSGDLAYGNVGNFRTQDRPLVHQVGMRLGILVVAVSALPWLSIKYAPVAAALAIAGGVRVWRSGRRRELALATAALAMMGIAYLAIHRQVWGGWTVYASGDHFQGSGEFGVVGFRPNYPGRAQRLVSLLVDRSFGIAAWQPAWLLLVPALAAMAIRRPRGWPALVLPLVAGWLVATFVALTMHGYWWPGRQLVVVLPLAVLAVLWWLDRAGWRLRALAAGLGLAGVVTYGWLLADGWARRITWVSGFWETGAPLHRLVRPLLPDYTGDSYLPGHVVWAVLLLGCAAAGLWSVRRQKDPIPD
jgi:hypothetical protein